MSISEGQKKSGSVILSLKLKELAVKDSKKNGQCRKMEGKTCLLLETLILCDKVQHYASLMTFIPRHGINHSASLKYVSTVKVGEQYSIEIVMQFKFSCRYLT